MSQISCTLSLISSLQAVQIHSHPPDPHPHRILYILPLELTLSLQQTLPLPKESHSQVILHRHALFLRYSSLPAWEHTVWLEEPSLDISLPCTLCIIPLAEYNQHSSKQWLGSSAVFPNVPFAFSSATLFKILDTNFNNYFQHVPKILKCIYIWGKKLRITNIKWKF